MEITFLGTSGCVPTEKRNLSSTLINHLNQFYLFDCGEGTQRQMRISGINFMRIDHVFLTHLHADHFLGLGGMIQSMDFMERTRELNIHGPVGTQNAISNLLAAGTFILDSLTVKIHEITEPGLVYEDKQAIVSCAKSIHTANSLAYCFMEKPHRKFMKQKALDLGIPEGRLFSKLQHGMEVEVDGKKFTPDDVLGDPIPGRKVVISGDTRPTKNIIELAEDADVLVHDATFSDVDLENTKDSAHATAKQAAEIAVEANVKKLFLSHISQRYTEPKLLEEEARSVFPESFVAEDFLSVKVEKHW